MVYPVNRTSGATWVKTADLVRNIKESSDFEGFDGSVESWKYLLKAKLSDEQVPELIRQIQENGFIVPIRVYMDESDNWLQSEGHHRLAVAILLGIPEVPVTDNYADTGNRYEIQPEPDDQLGAYKLADMVDTAIDWDNWPNI